MRTIKRSLIVASLVALLLVGVLPVAAQSQPRTLTITENQINSSYRITNNPRRSISDLRVDLQPSQAVIYATLTVPNQDPYSTQTTLVPQITDGRVFWSATAVLVNGQPASDEVLAQINAIIVASWRYYIKEQAGTGYVTRLVITETDMTYTYDFSDWQPPDGEGNYDPETHTYTVSEDQINESYIVQNTPRRSVESIFVDLQPSQVIISATMTIGQQDPFEVTVNITPSLDSGIVTWTVTQILVDGNPADDALVGQINAAIATSWRAYFRQNYGKGRITAIEVTNDAIIYSLQTRQ
ncbi:MAG: hypothetical protein H6673_07575 [Anaerolineales bacterium]|nr:hypothetical protein [Anaerolineales bacterium]